MILSGHAHTIFRPECNASFAAVQCVARLNEDVGKVLPYLNALLGGSQYLEDPPEVMFHHHGRIIKVGAREIAINALKDSNEADKILDWLVSEINLAWESRSEIAPSTSGWTRPQLIESLRLLPRTNCKACGTFRWWAKSLWAIPIFGTDNRESCAWAPYGAQQPNQSKS